MIRYFIFGITSLGLLAGGCSKPQPIERPSTTTTAQAVAPTPTPRYLPTATPQPPPRVVIQEPAPAPSLTMETEPDWEAVYQETKTNYLDEFKAPALSSKISVRLRSGTERSGALLALNEKAVTLRNEQAMFSVERTQLHPSSRVRLFAEDYASYKAKKDVTGRKGEFDKRKQAFEKRKKIMARNAELQSLGVDVEDDGSVPAIKQYLQRKLAFPDSTEFISWYPPVKNGKGTQVRVKYKTRTEGFGMITERKIFFLNKEGRVYQVAAYKETPSE